MSDDDFDGDQGLFDAFNKWLFFFIIINFFIMNPFSGGGAGPNDPQSQMMLMSLMEVNEQNLIFFLMSNPDLVENDDNTKFRKNAISFARNIGAIIVGGTFLNV